MAYQRLQRLDTSRGCAHDHDVAAALRRVCPRWRLACHRVLDADGLERTARVSLRWEQRTATAWVVKRTETAAYAQAGLRARAIRSAETGADLSGTVGGAYRDALRSLQVEFM